MAPQETLKSQADRLARLLADQRGADVIAELQRLAVTLNGTAATLPGAGCETVGLPEGPGDVAIWHAEAVPGGTELRRLEIEGIDLWHWADVDYVPPPGDARRVVLIGESVARGWAYDPMITPHMVMSRHLEQITPGRYQCVDLAQNGATAEDLVRLVRQLPAMEPDVLVVFAGNNWGGLPELPALELVNDLMGALRDDGIPGMREAYLRSVVMPRVDALTGELLRLNTDCGTRIVVVVPEFDLQGWAPPDDMDVPVLPEDRFARWHELLSEAELAETARDWSSVVSAAREMAVLDGGSSPVPGRLIGRAGLAMDDGATARSGLEAARDALAGLSVTNTPRVTSGIRDALFKFASDHGFAAIDMGAATGSASRPELPDAQYFFDYCHLTDAGIELVMSRVADAVAGLAPGTTEPGAGLDPPQHAVMHVISAAYGAFHGQRAEFVGNHLRLALQAYPEVRAAMTWLLDVLEGSGPVWARPSIPNLAGLGPGSALFGPVLVSRNLPPEMWTLRSCLAAELGRSVGTTGGETDLLAPPYTDGLKPPNLVPGRAFFQATARRSTFFFAASDSGDGSLNVSYRMPAPAESAAMVTVNGQFVGPLPGAADWTSVSLSWPPGSVQRGVNQLVIEWPVPVLDADRDVARDMSAMSRGQFPYVLPVYGELFEARAGDALVTAPSLRTPTPSGSPLPSPGEPPHGTAAAPRSAGSSSPSPGSASDG